MKTIIKLVTVFIVLIACRTGFAQTNAAKALEKGSQAVKLEDEGKYDEAIKLLEESQKLDPGNIDYPYELAYSYYHKEDYKKAVQYLEGTIKDKNSTDRFYQLLGNSYDNLGKTEKAISTYEAGLKRFPNSGNLYLELGIIQMGKKENNKALAYFEKGIRLAPKFASNYYWAARFYCGSTEQVWGMIYGEIFMNLERATKRTSEISKLLYDTYKSQITFKDNSVSVSFSKQSVINVNDLKDTTKFKLPFGVGCYEIVLMMSAIGEKAIDINSLDRIRTNFVNNYFEKDNNKRYPNILFDYQQQLLKAGHLEAYNHWIVMKGDEEGFTAWQEKNKDKWEAFVRWFSENRLQLDDDHKFYSSQY